MVYRKVMLIGLLSFPFLFNIPTAMAAPPENELNQYLNEIEWTKQELFDYLDYYEIPLDAFNTVEELKEVMGTPISPKNFQELLTKYELTEKELQDLFNHFGDSLNEYKFIEDLDASVEFYVHYDDYMAEIENELAEIGITEEESERFFEYLTQVEENNKDQLDKMTTLDTRLEKFYEVTDLSELTEEELDELVQILNESIALYEIQVKFKIDNKDVTLKELLKMKEIPNNLYTSIHSTTGELLIDFSIPAEFFETGDVTNEGEEIIHLGELSDEFVDHKHEEKYKNAEKGYK